MMLMPLFDAARLARERHVSALRSRV